MDEEEKVKHYHGEGKGTVIGKDESMPRSSGTPPYFIWHYQNGVQKQQVGMSQDIPSAASLAAAWIIAGQINFPTKGANVQILDSLNAQMAYVGWM